MIVVDVNTIVYLWLPGDQTELAERALARDPVWVTILLWRSEFRNVLAGYLRRGELDLAEASRCMDRAEAQLASHEFLPLSSQVMAKVAASKCSAYDCEYVALAEDLDAKLVTSDKQILSQFPERAVSLRAFAASG